MTHEEQRVWMIRQLLNEDPEYKRYAIPDDEQEQKNLLRALMNVRPPHPISQEFLDIQDSYLAEENARAGITDVDTLQPCKLDDRIILWQGDMLSSTCFRWAPM